MIVANLKNKTYFAVISKLGQAQEFLDYLRTKIEINGGGSSKMLLGVLLSQRNILIIYTILICQI